MLTDMYYKGIGAFQEIVLQRLMRTVGQGGASENLPTKLEKLWLKSLKIIQVYNSRMSYNYFNFIVKNDE